MHKAGNYCSVSLVAIFPAARIHFGSVHMGKGMGLVFVSRSIY